MALNDVYRVSAVFDAAGADGDLVFTNHYRVAIDNQGFSGAQEADELAQKYSNVLTSEYMQEITTAFILNEVNVIGVTDPTVIHSRSVVVSGSASGDSCPLRTAPVASLKSGLRGRSFNGRMFLMPPPESVQAGGVMIASYVADLELVVFNLRILEASLGSNEYAMVIYSRKLSEEQQTVVTTDVATSLVRTTLGSQRGRQST